MGFIDMMVEWWKELSILGRIGLILIISALIFGHAYANFILIYTWIERGLVGKAFVVLAGSAELALLYQFVAMVATMKRAPRAKD